MMQMSSHTYIIPTVRTLLLELQVTSVKRLYNGAMCTMSSNSSACLQPVSHLQRIEGVRSSAFFSLHCIFSSSYVCWNTLYIYIPFAMSYRDQYIAISDSITNQVVVPIEKSTLLQLCSLMGGLQTKRANVFFIYTRAFLFSLFFGWLERVMESGWSVLCDCITWVHSGKIKSEFKIIWDLYIWPSGKAISVFLITLGFWTDTDEKVVTLNLVSLCC